MAVAAMRCTFLALLVIAAAVDARAEGKADDSSKPYATRVDCPHPRLLAGIEAKWSELPEISSFLAAAKISGLLNTVFAYHRYTILAPSNDAFDKLATSMGLSGAEELLVEARKDFLTEVIRFHFGVGGAHYTSSLEDGGDSTRVQVFAPDQYVEASSSGGRVTIKGPSNTAVVLKGDLPLCSSVMHVVDTVIVPVGREHVVVVKQQRADAGTAEL